MAKRKTNSSQTKEKKKKKTRIILGLVERLQGKIIKAGLFL